jgi:hypothetical protein
MILTTRGRLALLLSTLPSPGLTEGHAMPGLWTLKGGQGAGSQMLSPDTF